MLKADIKPGKEDALRERHVVIGGPLERVRILAHVRGSKWRAEWIEPNPGLVHFVESARLVSTWRDHKAFLKEEEQRERLRVTSETDGDEKDSPLDRAMYTVFESVADDLQYYNGALSGAAEAIARVKTRAGMGINTQSAVGYVDRRGRVHIPFGDVVELARAFCGVEPSTVLTNIEATELKWSRDARRPGEEHMIGLLNEYRATWALIRQWAGHDAALAQREAEIERLERLVWDAVYALQKAGLERESTRLRRALGSD